MPLLAFLLVGMVPLPLQAQPDISVTIPEVEPMPGEVITLSIEANLSGEEADAYSNMVFKFDSGVLNIVEVRDGSELSFGSNNLTANENEDELRVSNTTSSPVSGDGEFLQIDVELTTGLQNPGTVFRLTPSDPTGVSTSVFEKNGTIFEISSIDQGRVGNLEVQTGRQEGTGSTATVTGTVTRAFGSYVRFQDDSDSNSPSGLTIGGTSGDFKEDIGSTITKRTRLYVRGTLSESGGLLRVDDSGLKNYVVLGQGTLPTAQNVSLSQLQSNGENYESELLRITGVSFPSASGSFSANQTYTVGDGTVQNFDYRVEGSNQTNLVGEPIPNGTFTYEGVLGESSGGYHLVPIRPATALPVTLTGFTAVRNGSSVVLTWRTASETNNAGFRVQYDRAAGWEELGFVPSTVDDGTTGEAQSYRFTVDRRLGPGTHRFRLEQVDLDRTTTLSDTVQVEIDMEGALHLSAPAPNPASEQSTLSFAVREGTEAEVVLYNMLGQRVKTLYKGTPRSGESKPLTFDASGLSSGAYVVQLRAEGQTQTQRLTVVR